MGSWRDSAVPPTGSLVTAGRVTGFPASEGYRSWARARDLPPLGVVDRVEEAGLRGRGGSGFPTAWKWRAAREHPGPRFLVVNGAEGEPDSLKDRLLMECYPHRILEGALIAAHALGATRVYVYINRSFPGALGAMRAAVADARAAGYLSAGEAHHAAGPLVEVVEAPPVYVAGEETAALEVIEGRPPRPRRRPPYPAESGLWGQPTIVHNVETLAAVEAIFRMGPEVYCRSATVLVTLAGWVTRPGVYEVPLGTPLRELIETWGGGVRGGVAVKAISPGGLGSPYLPATALETPLEYEALREAGSVLGCATVRVIPQGACMVEELQRVVRFFASGPCGQCRPCVQGTGRMSAVLEGLRAGRGGRGDIDLLARLGARLPGRGICGYLTEAAGPVYSALSLFWEDFEHHLRWGTCPGRRVRPEGAQWSAGDLGKRGGSGRAPCGPSWDEGSLGPVRGRPSPGGERP